VNEEEVIALRKLAMSAAEACGCHAGIEIADFLASAGDPAGSIRMKIVVARRSPRGELLSHESNVVIVTGDLAETVERIVRHAATKLTKRCRQQQPYQPGAP
jgi:hypothetical protein